MRSPVVVGAAGFLGSHLCRALAREGLGAIAIDRHPLLAHTPVERFIQADFGAPAAISAIAESGADTVFLLGGSSLVAPSLDDPIHDLETNAVALLRFLDGVRRTRARPFIVFTSSAAVYGNPERLPIRVTDALRPVSPYGVSKLAGEHYARIHRDLYGLPTASVRPFSVYGPGLRKQVVWDILRRFEVDQPEPLLGDGTESRDFIHVDDVVGAMLAIGRARGKGPYNVCSGEETSIADLAARLALLVDKPPLCFTGVPTAGSPRRWRGDAEELHALGWRPSRQLEDGLRETVQWYRQGSP